MRARRSIQAKITLGILALLVLMTAATSAVVLDRSQEALRAEITAAHEARSALVTQALDGALADLRILAAGTVAHEGMWEPIPAAVRDANGTVPPDGESAKRLLLEHAHLAHDLAAAAAILDLDGRLVLAEPYFVQVAYQQIPADSPPGEQLAAIARAAESTPGGLITTGPATGGWITAAALRTETREPWGVLLLIGDPHELSRLMLDAARAETVLFLVDSQGRLVAGTGTAEPGTDLDETLGALRATPGATQVVQVAGQDHLATAQSLSAAPWTLIVATDTSVAFAPANAMLRTILLVAGIVMAAGVGVAVAVGRSLSAPVGRLQRAAERVAAGEYGTQVRATTRDELAELTAAFNTMSARLLEEHQRVRRQQEHLEATVADRTRELAEKNQELEAFAYAASHDLRTPLIALDWLLQEAREQLDAGDAGAVIATLARMTANVEGMDRLISDLLELSLVGRTEGEPGPVPLGAVLETVLERLAEHAKERGTTIHAELPDEVVVVADPRRMEQLFLNLVGNAIKYGKPGGSVWVRATAIGSAERPWKWRVEVADDGPGVPEEQREEIFMLFRRGEQAMETGTEGTGVGLALARKIVRAYGGDLQVSRAHEGGALFWFTLTAARSGGIGAALQAAGEVGRAAPAAVARTSTRP